MSMRSRVYDKAGRRMSAILGLSLLLLCGCSGEKPDFSPTEPDENGGIFIPQAAEGMTGKEIAAEENAQGIPGASAGEDSDVPQTDISKAETIEIQIAKAETVETQTAEMKTAEPQITEANWETYFDGLNGAAVIYSPLENHYQIYNQEMALTERSPCSTFKIISSLIGLERGVINLEDSTRKWSGEWFWNSEWNKDIDFPQAFRTSCVWYYRQVIDEIGKEAMQQELDRLHYGNADISDWEGRRNTNNQNPALTGFWIESSLKISPREQAEVMERIFSEASVYSAESRSRLKQVMFVTELSDSQISIYGKTGMGKAHGVTVDTWFTGFTDVYGERRYFCVYLGETEGREVTSTRAKEIAGEILKLMENQ